jgi:tetratricopeptide (TPR) repeat protein
LGLLVYPKTLSADYSYDQIPVVTSPDVATLLSGLALAGLALSAFALRVRAPAASFGVFLFLLSWTLTSNLPIIIGTIFGERLLYLPSAGACLAVASGLIAAGRRVPGRGFATVAITALAVAGGARTWARNPDWNDNLTLFAAAATASPRSCKALDGYASELFTAGRPREAIAWAERALAIYPSYPGAHKTLGKSLRVMANEEGDPAKRRALRERASEHVRTVIALYASSLGGGSGLADAWNLSASLALDRGDTDAALEDFGKSLEVDPAYVPSINGSGVVWAMRADREIDPRRRDDARQAASKLFEHALALDPGNAEALQNAAAMLRELASSSEDEGTRADLQRRAETHETQAFAARRDTGDAVSLANLHGLRATQLLGEKRFPEALAEFREAARLEPQAARAYLGIGTVLAAEAEDERIATRRLALVDEAIRSFERALALEPDNPDAHLNLGITYLRQRHDPAKVVEHFRAYLRLVPGTPQRARMEETIRQMDAARDR